MSSDFNPRNNPNRSLRRRRRRASKAPVIILTLLLLICILGSVGFFLLGNILMLPGSWHRSISLTDTVEQSISTYLGQAAGGNDIVVKDYLGELKLDYSITLDRRGSFVADISDASYAECEAASRQALRSCIIALLEHRLELSSINIEATPEELVHEALGMKLDEYLDTYAPTLLPPLSDFKAEYFMVGSFTPDRNSIQFTSENGQAFLSQDRVSYMISPTTLVLSYDDITHIYSKE